MQELPLAKKAAAEAGEALADVSVSGDDKLTSARGTGSGVRVLARFKVNEKHCISVRSPSVRPQISSQHTEYRPQLQMLVLAPLPHVQCPFRSERSPCALYLLHDDLDHHSLVVAKYFRHVRKTPQRQPSCRQE